MSSVNMKEYGDWFASSRLDKCSEDWTLLPLGAATSGQFRVMRARELARKGRCQQVCEDALEYLFEMRQIDALGGRLSIPVLESLLAQFVSNQRGEVIVVHATSRSLQVMRSFAPNGQELCRVQSLVEIRHDPEPTLVLNDRAQAIIMPQEALGLRSDPLRFLYGEVDGAKRYTLWSTQTAHDPQDGDYEDQQQMITIATPERHNLERMYRGMAPIGGEGATTMTNLNAISIECPTIRIDRLSLRPSGWFAHARMSINFTPGGENLRGINVKFGDFGGFLKYFPREFTEAMRKRLAG